MNIEGDPRTRVLGLLRRHGWNTTSFQVLEHGFSYWFDPLTDSCIAYLDTGRAWVAAGAPIAADEVLAESVAAFVAAASLARRRVCFFAVEERLVEACRGALSSMPIGEQPSWDPTSWPEALASDRRLREQLRRAQSKGVTVRAVRPEEISNVEAPLRQDVELLIGRWVQSRKMAPMGFIVDVQPFDFAEERRCFVAERDAQIIGVLVAVPVYRRAGWLFEDILRSPNAPNGTTELLIDAAMRAVAGEGSRYATLGLAPLAGDIAPGLRFLRAAATALYDFDGVRRFKAKLRPERWTRIDLAWPSDASGNRALLDALAAFTMRPRDGHERASFVRFGVETIAHSPAAAVRLLALLLGPWTIALALAPTDRFFPSRAVQLAWVAFDVVVGLAMLSLASRWREGLARALAIATSADAVLTFAEVVLDARHRVTSPLDGFVLVAACLGPCAAASLLWTVLASRPAVRVD